MNKKRILLIITVVTAVTLPLWAPYFYSEVVCGDPCSYHEICGLVFSNGAYDDKGCFHACKPEDMCA